MITVTVVSLSACQIYLYQRFCDSSTRGNHRRPSKGEGHILLQYIQLKTKQRRGTPWRGNLPMTITLSFQVRNVFCAHWTQEKLIPLARKIFAMRENQPEIFKSGSLDTLIQLLNFSYVKLLLLKVTLLTLSRLTVQSQKLINFPKLQTS